MEELFAKKKRRSPFLLAGSIVFGLLGLAAVVALFQDGPMAYACQPACSLFERIVYRLGAVIVCGAMSVFLFPRTRSARPARRDDRSQLL